LKASHCMERLHHASHPLTSWARQARAFDPKAMSTMRMGSGPACRTLAGARRAPWAACRPSREYRHTALDLAPAPRGNPRRGDRAISRERFGRLLPVFYGDMPRPVVNLVRVSEPGSCIVDSIAGEKFKPARALRDRLPPGLVPDRVSEVPRLSCQAERGHPKNYWQVWQKCFAVPIHTSLSGAYNFHATPMRQTCFACWRRARW
jgi:hypothetical protein